MKKKVPLAVISAVLLSLVVTFAATTSLSDTPLYTYRMEQASSEMGFLPAKMNEFTYNTEKGFELVFIVAGCCDVEPCGDTWYWTCSTSTCYRSTCGGVTCWNSCRVIHAARVRGHAHTVRARAHANVRFAALNFFSFFFRVFRI